MPSAFIDPSCKYFLAVKMFISPRSMFFASSAVRRSRVPSYGTYLNCVPVASSTNRLMNWLVEPVVTPTLMVPGFFFA